jgi:hypothetical protein
LIDAYSGVPVAQLSRDIRRNWFILPTPIHHDEVVTVRVHFAKEYRHGQIQNQIQATNPTSGLFYRFVFQ